MKPSSTRDAPWARMVRSRPDRLPLLAMQGEQEEYGSLEHHRHIAGLGRGATEPLTLPDCRHVPHREHPAAVLAAVRRFLAPLD